MSYEMIIEQELRLQLNACSDRTFERLMKNNKGLSQVIGVLLMVAVVVVIGALVIWMTSDIVTSKTAVTSLRSILGR